MKNITKAIALCLALLLCLSFPISASALEVNNTTIDTDAKGSLTIYKVDLTNAEKDGVWDSSYVSTGVYDQDVYDAIIGAASAGDTDDILFAILVVLVALLLPMVMVVCLFSGRFQVDTAELQRHVEANLTAADVQLLRSVEDTMAEIEFAMIDAELSSEVGAAQALYIMALYDYSSQPGFVSRLVSCFGAEQTDDQLVANVNAAFGTDIVVQDFTNVMRNVRSRRIDTTKYVDCGTKNNLDLVQWAISAYQSRWGYVMGTFGQVLTVDLLEAKLQQLPDAIGPYEDYIRANYLGVRTADCIGLIKGYSWYDPESGNINYGSNGMPDVSADQIYAQAAEKGSMVTMPEIPGILVHAPGHIGIYIGNGYAIEAMGTRYGVVKTAVASRNWTGWCKNPYINYIEETEEDT